MQHSPIRKPLGTAIMLVLAGGANSAAAGNTSSIATDAAGNTIVAWQDNSGADGYLGGIFARRYNSSGTAAAAFQVNTTSPGDQRAPASAMAANGASVVVWQSTDEGGDNGIYAQRYAADGTAAGGEFRVNTITSGAQQNPTVAMNANGDFVVAWEDALGDGSGFGIMARAYLADGSAVGDAFAVNSVTAADQLNPSVALADSGAFTVSWLAADSSIRMQRYDANGLAVGGETSVTAAPAPVANAKGMIAGGIYAAGVLTTGVDLGLTMKGSASGNTLTYTIKVTNNGTLDASTVSLVDTLPSNTSYLSGSGTSWTCSNTGGVVTCDLASLASAASSTVTINVGTTGANATSLTNTAVVSSSATDANSADNTASVVTTTGSSGTASTGVGAFGWFGLLLGFFGLRRRWK